MRYLVRPADVAPYSPANHEGTRNFRLIGPETVGAKQLEVLVGEVEKGKGALPHAHGVGGVEMPREKIERSLLASDVLDKPAQEFRRM